MRIAPSGTTQTQSQAVWFVISGNLQMSTYAVTVNGVDSTAKFPLTACTGGVCSGYQFDGTWLLAVGANSLSISACSPASAGNQGSCAGAGANVTYTYLTVSPKGNAVNGGISFATSQQFWVHNVSLGSATYNLTTACSGTGVSGCGVPASVTIPRLDSAAVLVSYTSGASGTTGTVKLKAAYASIPTNIDSGYVSETSQWGTYLAVSTAYTNHEDEDFARCAVKCFAASATLDDCAVYLTGRTP